VLCKEVCDINSLEVLSDLINEEWSNLKILYAEPWGIPWVVPPDERDDYEIHFIEQGYGKFSIGNKVYDVIPGDVVMLHSMKGNSFSSESDTFRIFYVTFSFENPSNHRKIREFNRLLEEESFPMKMNGISNIKKILYAMHREITAKSVGHDLRMRLNLGILVMEIMDTWNQQKGLGCISHVYNSDSCKLVNKVIVYLQDNYNTDIKLKDIGKLVNRHPRYLCALFKQFTGKTISEYIRRFRIEKAKRLLLYTSLSITEIAYEVGYNNSQYFSKVFSQVEGVEPRVFRKMRKSI